MKELRRTVPALPVRHVHLGLGNFFRAHQAWYSSHAGHAGRAADEAGWGIAAFTGRGSLRSNAVAAALTMQGGVYTLVTRASDGDRFELINTISRVHTASDQDAWLGYFADPRVQVVTTTVTEAGYLRGADGGLAADLAEVRAEVAALRGDLRAPVRSAPARLVAGFAARRSGGGGPVTVVPCDNLPRNGSAVARVVGDLAGLVDPRLSAWITDNVAYVTTMVDRITPVPTADDLADAQAGTGVRDRAAVVTEPFSEWVIGGDFAADRPRWEDAGATFTADVAPFEQRKLWLLNGAHTLLAYAGSIRGHVTVADAMRDQICLQWLDEWWEAASRHLRLPSADNEAYRAALTERFANPRMLHRLDQIAWDGSQKLPIRVLPVLRRERAAGRLPAGAIRPLAAWVCHLRGAGANVTDARAGEFRQLASGPLPEAVRLVLKALDPELAVDDAVMGAVLAQAQELGQA